MSSAPTAFRLGSEVADGGRFRRQQSAFRDWVTRDGSSRYPAEAGRYHLYVSYACPWASRAVIVRQLKGLEDVVSMSAVDPVRDERGWAFTGGEYTDPLEGFELIEEAYRLTADEIPERLTVPVLWDRETRTVVNNESADVIRMFNDAFDEAGADPEVDLYPAELREEIDAINERVYSGLNDAVYRAGFATSQDAYAEAFGNVFDTLDWLEGLLAERRYLLGDRITEADWRLFTTLVRFDVVYVLHFKCNRNRLVDMPNLWGYTRELYQEPGVADTVRFDKIKRHYFCTHPMINPHSIVPLGPRVDFAEPHGRGTRAAA
jgi:glutathionyl-hydroquinone reductase